MGQFLAGTSQKKGYDMGKTASEDLAVTPFNISCFLIPGIYGSLGGHGGIIAGFNKKMLPTIRWQDLDYFIGYGE